MIRVQLLGANELVSKFKALGEAVGTQYIDEAMQTGIEYMQGEIERIAPRRTGRLASGINLRNIVSTTTEVTKGIVIDGVRYWRYVEFGHKTRTPHGRWTRAGDKWSRMGAFSRGWVKAKSFARRAFRNRKTTARQVIRDTFRDRIHGFTE